MTSQNSSMPFSQRNGLAPLPVSPSIGTISPDLRADLLNALMFAYPGRHADDEMERRCSDLALDVWAHFLHEPINDPPRVISGSRCTVLFDRVLDAATRRFEGMPDWWLCDLLEFVASNPHARYARALLHEQVNQALERNFAAVRIVDGLITPITDEQQRKEIEIAIQTPLVGVQTQLHNALALLSDHDDPKYSDSIKNSISAVETLCRKITGKNKATLGQALKRVKDAGVQLHPSLERAFE